jgi:LysM domain
MTVAPELPPVSTARAGGARRLRAVRVDRTPAGVVALVEPPRPRGSVAVPAPLVAPAPPIEPGPGIGREHRPVDPTTRPARGRTVRPAAPSDPAARPARRPDASADAAVRPVRRPDLSADAAVRPVRRPDLSADAAVDGRPSRRAGGPVDAVAVGRPSRLDGGPAAGTIDAPAPVEHVRPERRRPGSPAASGVRPGAVGVPAMGRRAVGERVVRPAPGPLRLTRRGRLVTAVATLLIAGFTLVGVASRAGSLAETAPVPASAPAQVVVAPGETLWSIAQRVAPDRDPRTVVAGIQRLNDMPTADVHAGQTLVLRAP